MLEFLKRFIPTTLADIGQLIMGCLCVFLMWHFLTADFGTPLNTLEVRFIIFMIPLVFLATGTICLFGSYIHRKYDPAEYALAQEQDYHH